MENLLIRKLECFEKLSAADRCALGAIYKGAKIVDANTDLIEEGDPPKAVFLIVTGFACRYKLQRSGRRTIMAYLLPGDLCDPNVFVLRAMDHSIATLVRSKVITISREVMLEITTKHPAIARALWWSTLVDEGTLREWLVNVGGRPAFMRIGHLLCELLLRMQAVGLASENRFSLPITQVELADTVGLSAVHVNRALGDLRRRGLVTWDKRQLTILDVPGLIDESGFNSNYLHLQQIRTSIRDG